MLNDAKLSKAIINHSDIDTTETKYIIKFLIEKCNDGGKIIQDKVMEWKDSIFCAASKLTYCAKVGHITPFNNLACFFSMDRKGNLLKLSPQEIGQFISMMGYVFKFIKQEENGDGDFAFSIFLFTAFSFIKEAECLYDDPYFES